VFYLDISTLGDEIIMLSQNAEFQLPGYAASFPSGAGTYYTAAPNADVVTVNCFAGYQF
jgi:hypothetical protein